MNRKITAILLELTVALKKVGWTAGKDWEITLQSEGHVPLIKRIIVQGALGGQKWKDSIETYIDLKLTSDDEITYFPDYTIYAHIALEGVDPKDLAYKMGGTVAFTDKDIKKTSKISDAAKKIDRLIEIHINHEYQDYLDTNENKIKPYKMEPSSTTNPNEPPRRPHEFFED